MDDFLRFERVRKQFGPLTAVDNVDLSVRQGEVFSLLGPSGCGKTTLLRMCAGFASPDEGRIILEGVDLTGLRPDRRPVNTVFQNYALFPHLSVRENIAFGLRMARAPRQRIVDEVDRMLDMTDMAGHADKRVTEISGGQKQRVAIARALVNRPRVLLLDEPLAALDRKLRQRMLLELDRIHDEVGITFLYVTHDQDEAMSISDRLAVMHHGRVEQVGSPAEVYEAPRSSFVAAFIGDTNFFDGQVTETAAPQYSRLRIDGFADVLVYNDKQPRAGDPVFLSLRPEKLNIQRTEPSAEEKINRVKGVVEEIVYLGSQTRYWVRVGVYRVEVVRLHRRFLLDEKPIDWDEPVWLTWHADDGYMLERYSVVDERLLTLPDDEFLETEFPAAEMPRDHPTPSDVDAGGGADASSTSRREGRP